MPGPPRGPLVPDDDDVAGLQGALGDGVHRALLAVEDPGGALEDRRRRTRRTSRPRPPGASDPRRIVSPPVVWIGSFIAWMIVPSGSGGAISARFSAIVLPVTVSASPCSRPASSSARSTTGTPPMRSMSVMTNRPNGLTSARCGVRSPIRLKSSRVRSTCASCAIAIRCRTALVEPPSAMTTVIAFSNAFLVMIWRAVMPLREQVHHGLAGGDREGVAAAVGRRRRGAAGQRHAERLGDAGHRVGGVHAAAGALARAGGLLDRGRARRG